MTYTVEIKKFQIGKGTTKEEITMTEAKKRLTKKQWETLMEKEIINTKYGLIELKRVD